MNKHFISVTANYLYYYYAIAFTKFALLTTVCCSGVSNLLNSSAVNFATLVGKVIFLASDLTILLSTFTETLAMSLTTIFTFKF